jgi:alpha-tubulin suppressor-like RCC1 family protein
MNLKPTLVLGVFLLLAGCGTLQVQVDTPVTAPPTTRPVLPSYPPTHTITPTSTLTPTVTAVPTETLTPSPTPLPDVLVPIAAGKSHTCAVTAARGIRCWGNNEHGQLGDGTTTGSRIPVDVRGLEGVTALTAGWGHTCALTSAGAVWCWGYNKYGELGDGGTQDSAVPLAVTGLDRGVAAIEAGDDHTCAVMISGAVVCWGYNEDGQLGDGTQISRSKPVAAGGFESGIRSIAAGWGHTCALTVGGGVKCWGNNEYGQLGYGSPDSEFRPVPVDVNGQMSGVGLITADGGSTCALTEGGGLRCWGNNKYGQLGNDTAVNQFDPVEVIGISKGAAWAAAGWNHSCALSGGALMCWGWNLYGQLGDGTKGTRLKPRKAVNLTDGAAAVALGWAHTCAATNGGRVACWGSNADGQLGDGTADDRIQPAYVAGLETSVRGDATPAGITPTAATAPAALRISPITAGSAHTCRLTSAGGVRCWGDNRNGQLGDGGKTDRNIPVDVAGLTKGVKAVEAGLWHTCALTNRGGVKCWGNNEYGQLGDGTKQDRPNPVDVTGLESGVTALAAGTAHTCALTVKGGVKCWGWNKSGQLGDGTTRDRQTPVDVAGLGDAVALTAGAEHNCVLTAAGGVTCWGSHSSGKGEFSYSPNASVPTAVAGLSSGVTNLFSGAFYNCVWTTSGAVKCWGNNSLGQFGNGTTGATVDPLDITGLPDSTVPIAGSWGHTCGVSASGIPYCWGLNDRGQLGDGTRTLRLTPVAVSGLTGVVAFALGYGHTCALTAANEIWCWGANDHGELGNGTDVISLVPVKAAE